MDNTIGYKYAITDAGIRVVITLQIPEDAKTNMYRKSIIDRTKAKYRCSYALVLKIEDADGGIHPSARSMSVLAPVLYETGKYVYPDTFNPDEEAVCTSGIHFYIDRECAETYVYPVRSKTIRNYYASGSLMSEQTFREGLKDGPYCSWYENGTLQSKAMYRMDRQHGVTIGYRQNGKKDSEIVYSDGLRLKCTLYDKDENIEEISYFEAGMIETRMGYYANSVPRSITSYNRAENSVQYKTYDESGQLKESGCYKTDSDSHY